ncbi:MAG: ABC transporter permease [bacterium]
MQNWRQQLHLIGYKAYSDLLAEASRGSLGLLWWVLEPVLYLGAFYIIFELALQRGGEGFVPFLLTGLVIWKWFAASITNASNSITIAGGLISQVYVPKLMFPFAVISVATFKFLIVFCMLIVFLLIYGVQPSLTWLSLGAILLVQLIFVVSSGSLVAAVVPVLPDLKLIIDNLLLMMFFLSGVFFDIGQLEGTLAYDILSLNPMYILIECYRQVLLQQQWPDWQGLIQVMIWSALLLTAALLILRKMDRIYPKLV